MTIEINEGEYLLIQLAIELHRKFIAQKLSDKNWKGSEEYKEQFEKLGEQLSTLSTKLREQRKAQVKIKINKIEDKK